MQDIDLVLLSTSIEPLVCRFLGIERNEVALVSWLQKQAIEVVGTFVFSYCPFITSSLASKPPVYHSFRAICVGRLL